MPHPKTENLTPFACDLVGGVDEAGRSLAVFVVKATYDIDGSSSLRLAEQQVPIDVAGTLAGDPENPFYVYEPESTWVKTRADVALLGRVFPQSTGAKQAMVGLAVGPLQKVVRVVGDRHFVKVLGHVSMTDPRPVAGVPLSWDRAFGGWDRSHPDPAEHRFEPRNPVGTAFRARSRVLQEGGRAPNLEHPSRAFKGYGDRPEPVGFGFIGPHWEPRFALAGTFDAEWNAHRKPLLPRDFKREYFNAAPTDQILPGFLNGGEPVAVTNASPRGRLAFRLPEVGQMAARVWFREGGSRDAEMRLDTLIINTDDHRIFLLWRAALVVRNGIQNLAAARLECRAPHSSGRVRVGSA